MSDDLPSCYECDADAAYWVEEQWDDEGMGVEFFEPCCMDHVPDPQHYEDGGYAQYSFSIEPIPEYFGFTELS